MPRIVPAEWMPPCHMDRVITHWTAGGYRATTHDRDCYHLLVEGDGHLIRGHHAISDNVSTSDGDYAAHTRGKNGGSIGVAVCCMADAQEPRAGQEPHFGPAPMNEQQYAVLAAVVADLCEKYQIDVRPATVLGLGEVEQILGVQQNGKWDPMVLPWDPGKSRSAVGTAFRETVQGLLAGAGDVTPQPEALLPVIVTMNGAVLSDEGILLKGGAWCPLRPLATNQGWNIALIDGQHAVLQTAAGAKTVEANIRSSRGYVAVKDVCAQLGWSVTWIPTTRTAAIRTV